MARHKVGPDGPAFASRGRKPTGTVEAKHEPRQGRHCESQSNAALPGLERESMPVRGLAATAREGRRSAAPNRSTVRREPCPPFRQRERNMARFTQEICLIAGCLLVAAAVWFRCWELGRVPGVNGDEA